mmetsp:Transcript_21331/g.52066  ORF Transcript_21331/g.52066 Transcript_21331/m.52066 type:complete len:113 (+) Transcript_21331:243-581(+)
MPTECLVAELPVEVELRIIERLRSARDIARVRAVCRRWRRLVDGHLDLWRRMEFSLPRRAPEQAERWYRKAADCGNASAAMLLALLYNYGYRCRCHSGPTAQPALQSFGLSR